MSGSLGGRRGGGKRSQLLQSTVHVSLAALPGPGAALEAKLPEVLLEVLVVHGPVVLRFTLCLKMGEEVFVSALEDVELGIVEVRILVDGAVSLTDEAAHPRAALRRELAVEDDDHPLLRAGWDHRRLEEEVLHLQLLVQVQRPLDVSSLKLVGVAAVDDDDSLN